MTLNDEFFKYVDIVEDEYVLKDTVPDKIKPQITDYIYDVKKLYKHDIKIKGFGE